MMLLIVSSVLFLAQATGSGASGSSSAAEPGKSFAQGVRTESSVQKSQPASPGSGGALADRVVVRGWQIVSLTAIKRNSITDIFPAYQNQKPVGNQSESKAPRKGKFVVILVQSQSATQLPLNEPLWVGRPDVTLVDDVGLEYPALGRLIQQGGDYVETGMITGRNRVRGPRFTDTSLVYFDVPPNVQNFWLRFPGATALLAVGQATNLPAITTD